MRGYKATRLLGIKHFGSFGLRLRRHVQVNNFGLKKKAGDLICKSNNG